MNKFKENIPVLGGALILIFLILLIGYFWFPAALIFKIQGTLFVIIIILLLIEKSME